jgi:hypothetical protein
VDFHWHLQQHLSRFRRQPRFFVNLCQLVQLWRHVFQQLMAALGLSQAPLLIVHVILVTLVNLASLSALAISPIDRSSRYR